MKDVEVAAVNRDTCVENFGCEGDQRNGAGHMSKEVSRWNKLK